MGKVGKALKALWWIARKPVLLNRVLTDEDTWKGYVQRKYGLSGGLPVIAMDRLFDAGSVALGPMTFLDGGSLPTDMMLLASLAEGIPGCRYFEIGTWRGESAATLSSRVKSCHTLCLTDEEMRAVGMDEKSIAAHRLFSKDLGNVIQLRGDSRRFDFGALGQKFDLVFIDGDHHHDVIVSDTRNVFRHLVHEKSIVVWHDYGFHPDLVRFEVMAAILDGAGPERTGLVYHVAHTKCAIFTGRRYASRPAEFPVTPEEYYTLEVTRKRVEKRTPGS
jgi:predicted O-methyltransferase YrrM